MAPKFKATYDAEADIPTQYADLFEERQGKWIIAKDAIEGWVDEGDIHRLSTANTKLRAELTSTKDRLQLFGETKPEDMHRVTQELEESRAALDLAGKPDDEKINNLVETRIKGRLAPLERELATVKSNLDTKSKEAEGLTSKITKGVISEAVRSAAGVAKVLGSAVPDVVALTSSIFEIVDINGREKVLTKDGVGVTPGLEPDAYFAEVGPAKPHWFAGSQGTGANGNRNSGGGYASDNPWSEENWNLTKQGQIIAQKGSDEATRLAKMAGSHVGATRATKRQTAKV